MKTLKLTLALLLAGGPAWAQLPKLPASAVKQDAPAAEAAPFHMEARSLSFDGAQIDGQGTTLPTFKYQDQKKKDDNKGQAPDVKNGDDQDQEPKVNNDEPADNGPLPAAAPGSAAEDKPVQESNKSHKCPKCDPTRIGKRDVTHWSFHWPYDKEIALGKYYANQVEREKRVIDDPVIAEYVNRVGQNVVRHSDAKVPFTIKVLDDKEINAFALPGGFFYVNSGLIMQVENESQLASVMGHEIAHVNARHQIAQMSRAELANWATIPLIFVGGWGGYGARQAVGLLLPVSFLKFQRGFEAEADYLGLQYEWASGYDPEEFPKVFQMLMEVSDQKKSEAAKEKDKKKRKKDGGGIFGTHPATQDRLVAANKEIKEIIPHPAEFKYQIDDDEFQMVKERLKDWTNQRHKLDLDANADKPSLGNPDEDQKPKKKGKKGQDKGADDGKKKPDLDPNADPNASAPPTVSHDGDESPKTNEN